MQRGRCEACLTIPYHPVPLHLDDIDAIDDTAVIASVSVVAAVCIVRRW
jgi:hypothetical protein